MLARAKRDYYVVLGVSRDADRETIKRAFRALAAGSHPDVSNDPDAAARFREIAEAYEILSRPESRARYDRRRHAGPGPAGSRSQTRRRPAEGGTPKDAPGFRRSGERGADVVTEAVLEFDEAIRGTSRGLRYAALLECNPCAGSGAEPGTGTRSCPACGGGGRVQEVGSTESARLLRLEVCGGCRGAGRIANVPCGRCRGLGAIEEERSLLVVVPAGSVDGDEIRLAGEGNAGGRGGEPGDVVVRLRVRAVPEAMLVRRLAAVGVLVAVALVGLTLAFH